MQEGLAAETRFADWVERVAPSMQVVPACGQDNMAHHWDVLVLPRKRGLAAAAATAPRGVRVDVKARRKAARSAAGASATHTWLELQSAQAEHVGSVFGDADLFAFEQQGGGWLLVPRNRVARWAMQHVSAATPMTRDVARATSSTDLMLYSRRDNEVLAWVPIATTLSPLALKKGMTWPQIEAAFVAARAAVPTL
jgi:hypothetical protein